MICDVIENGNSFKPVAQITTNADGTSTSLIPCPITTNEKSQKKNDLKARMLQAESLLTLFLSKKSLKDEKSAGSKSLDEKYFTSRSQFDIFEKSASEWNTHVYGLENKPDLDTISFDDLYNNFKVIKQEVKGTTSSSSSSSSQNMAFVSSPSSTNEVNTVYMRLFSPLKFDLSNSGLKEFQQHEFKGYGPKTSKSVSEDTSNEVKESHDTPLVKELVSDDKLEKKIVFPTVDKIESGKSKKLEQSKVPTARKNQGYVNMDGSARMTGNMSYLLDFKEFDGGYFAFMRSKVPERTIFDSVDIKNLFPKECLTCLVEKATLDESCYGIRELATRLTTSILRDFTKIENLVDRKVKIFRCDNGIEFKNRVMSEFCEQKGIKREFSEVDIIKKTEHQAKMTKLSMGQSTTVQHTRPKSKKPNQSQY
ncbi:ribonuclease H-like domain-containing protein [Tanacetum coccineum]